MVPTLSVGIQTFRNNITKKGKRNFSSESSELEEQKTLRC